MVVLVDVAEYGWNSSGQNLLLFNSSWIYLQVITQNCNFKQECIKYKSSICNTAYILMIDQF